MNKTLSAIFAVTAAVGVANAQNYVAIESVSGAGAGPQDSANLSGTPDLDPSGTFDSSYEYGGPYMEVITDEANDFPNDLIVSDANYWSLAGNDDQFYRVIASAPLANTENVASTAFAFRVDSLDSDPANNDTDYFRVMDINATGSSANIKAYTVRDGILNIQTNGIPDSATPTPGLAIADLSTLTLGQWYVCASRYDRVDNTLRAWLINASTGNTTTLNSATTSASNTAAIGSFAMAATFAAPSGTVDFETSLDDFTVYSNALDNAEFIAAVIADYSLPEPTNAKYWMMY